MIEIQNLTKTFGAGGTSHTALRDINLTIEDGDVFGIIGQSGAGKSTLVRCINLLEHPTSGKVLINGRDITGLKGKELLDLRSSIGMIFQNFSLFQQRTVLRNIVKQHPNKTCIVTTHRPSVLNLCQRVYRVMETKVTELSEEESSRMAMDF